MLLSQPLSIRPLKAIFAGTSITLGLLFFMTSLINSDVQKEGQIIDLLPIDPFQPPTKIDDVFKKRLTPEIPKPIFKPAPPMTSINATETPLTPVAIDKSSITESDIMSSNTGLEGIQESLLNGGSEHTASLTNPVAARYPREALEKELEGYVDVIFDITITGTTTNIRVLAAEPARVFNRNAIKAVRKWRYRPQVESGKAVMVTDVVARIHFELEK
ncbi:TonB family protein [Porticoccus sp. W117]|uniref:energy transducer TonB n=1 Tax=Porticoccus sp. W117 TaxID=3054777 RepID=UPI0025943391|nr:energy transducer TonB [Porticoccus sp. W117]MDM3869862.1 TonB family protein [Porticoccus sp. W117]